MRFASSYDVRDSGCWESRAVGLNGYGRVAVDGKRVAAHRLAYAIGVGAIPDGMYVCHKCDNKACCNPSHLFLGTHADNMADMARKGRHWLKQRPGTGVRGEAHRLAKLSEGDVRGIREALSAGYSQREVAKDFGVSQRLVWNIANRRAWPHV